MTTNADELVGAGTASVQNSHPLKGIINANDDPFACDLCLGHTGSLTRGDSGKLLACCGKEICLSCKNQKAEVRCPFGCKPGNEKGLIKMIKRHAKKGRPWAQVHLGKLYQDGFFVRKSISESFRWIDMAAISGHPSAMECLGLTYLSGTNSTPSDLSKARHYFEAVLALDQWDHDLCRDGLLQVAEEYLEIESDEGDSTAKSILLSISKAPPNDPNTFQYSGALLYLGMILEREENFADATEVLTESFASCTISSTSKKPTSKSDVAFELMTCSKAQDHLAQSSFWLRQIDLSAISAKGRREVAKEYVKQRAFLRSVRDICGACGAQFEGKERKFCGGCRTFCYFSRECQKMHWNRKDYGHREDCLGLKDLKMKLKEAKKKSNENGD